MAQDKKHLLPYPVSMLGIVCCVFMLVLCIHYVDLVVRAAEWAKKQKKRYSHHFNLFLDDFMANPLLMLRRLVRESPQARLQREIQLGKRSTYHGEDWDHSRRPAKTKDKNDIQTP